MKAGAGGDLLPGRRRPEALRTSPQLEGFRAEGVEVLLLSDPIDAFWPERLDEFRGQADPQRHPGRGRHGQVEARGRS